MTDDYILDKVLDKMKKTKSIKKLDDAGILIGIADKLSDEIALQNVIILVSCVIIEKNYLHKYL